MFFKPKIVQLLDNNHTIARIRSIQSYDEICIDNGEQDKKCGFDNKSKDAQKYYIFRFQNGAQLNPLEYNDEKTRNDDFNGLICLME